MVQKITSCKQHVPAEAGRNARTLLLNICFPSSLWSSTASGLCKVFLQAPDGMYIGTWIISSFLGDCVSTANSLKLWFTTRRACMIWNLLKFYPFYLFCMISLNLVWAECTRDANSVVLSGRYTSTSDHARTLDEFCTKADELDSADQVFDDYRLNWPL